MDNYQTREQWGAKPVNESTSIERIKNPRQYYDTIVIHHTERSQTEDIKHLQNYFQNSRGYPDIAYHFVIGKDGTIYEGMPINIKGWHVNQNNSRKIGIALMGNFHDGTGVSGNLKDTYNWIKGEGYTEPSTEQIESLKRLVKELEREYGITRVGGHRDFTISPNETDCPGNILYPILEKEKIVKLSSLDYYIAANNTKVLDRPALLDMNQDIRQTDIQQVSSREVLRTIMKNKAEINTEVNRLQEEVRHLQGAPLTWEQAYQRAASAYCGGEDRRLAKEAKALREERTNLEPLERWVDKYGRESGLATTRWRHAPEWLKSNDLKYYEAEEARLENLRQGLDRREAEIARKTQELQARLEKPEAQAEIKASVPAFLQEDQARLDKLSKAEEMLGAAQSRGKEISRLFNTTSFRNWEQGPMLHIQGDASDLQNILNQSGAIAQQMTQVQHMQMISRASGIGQG